MHIIDDNKEQNKKEESLFKSWLKYGAGFSSSVALARDVVGVGENIAKYAINKITN